MWWMSWRNLHESQFVVVRDISLTTGGGNYHFKQKLPLVLGQCCHEISRTKFHDLSMTSPAKWQNSMTRILKQTLYIHHDNNGNLIRSLWCANQMQKVTRRKRRNTYTSSLGLLSRHLVALIYKMLDLRIKFHDFPWLFSKFQDFSMSMTLVKGSGLLID